MYALVDCNNFYASCERVFCPSLNGKPIVILSNNDGCVIARSNEAKELGIKMGTPAFMVEDFLEQKGVLVYSSNYTLYGDLSGRVMQILQEFCSGIEIYSIDEAFLNLSGYRHHDLNSYATTIRNTILQQVGIPVSIGIAPTKTLAKMANRFSTKNCTAKGIFCIDTPEKLTEVLQYTGVKDIWGIGEQYARLLFRNGFKSAFDLQQAPPEWIRKNMSVVGERTLNELKGIPSIEFEDSPPAKKAICVARSFGKLLSSFQDIHEALANYTALCASKLRRQESCTQSIQVFIQTNVHRGQDKQYFRSINMQLPVATNTTGELLKYAGDALNIIYKPGYNFKKVGIMMLELVPEANIQSGLFDGKNRSKDKLLMKSVDKLNNHFGKDLVKFAVQGTSRNWKLRQLRLSPRYTTRLDEILTIKI